MKPNHVEAIVAIANAGSIRGAAIVLNKSQPAISSILKNAEELLGAQIFLREPGGMVPTEAGAEIIARSRTIANEFRRLEEQVKQIQGEQTGSIRIVVSPIAAVRLVPRAIAAFKKRYPDVRVHIDSGHAPSAYTLLRQGEADLVVVPSPIDDQEAGNLTVEKLFSDPLCFVAGSESLFATTTNLSDLEQAHWLMFGPKEREHIILGYLARLGIDPSHPINCSDSVLSIMALLEGSDAVCTCPQSLFQDLSQRWKIVQIPVDVKLDPIEMSVLTSAIRPPTSVTIALKEAVLKEAAKG